MFQEFAARKWMNNFGWYRKRAKKVVRCLKHHWQERQGIQATPVAKL
jgi:hypothetical protein